jgi:serine protease Do
VKLTVVRDKKSLPVAVSVAEMPAEEATPAVVERETEGLGLQMEPLTPDAAERLGLPLSQGLLVTDVAAGGPADRAGLRRGDIVLEVDRRPVMDLSTLQRALADVPVGDAVLVYVHRPGGGGRNQYLVLERGPRP